MPVLETRVGEIEGVDEGGGGVTLVAVGIGVGLAVAVGDGIEVDVGVGIIVGVAVGVGVVVGEGVVVEVGVVVGVDVSSKARVCFIPEFAATVIVAAIACGLLRAANAPMNESNMSMSGSTPTNTLPEVNLA
jgi:hypothetical protein